MNIYITIALIYFFVIVPSGNLILYRTNRQLYRQQFQSYPLEFIFLAILVMPTATYVVNIIDFLERVWSYITSSH